ncbi:hypothetical protein BP00DRAFT_124366 [Aspergillus indologenus CBS 114.80]|uniref:Uncharacterized protein n=1 Tax=Aspergillus indologenus CBS 114.80 TaxID=1450541 RepID=A0A2V5IXJ0_9EURO|nr:hypothetical protein BP00DRAFT_124366 [Aspergillus indologenus CBS 114.80]
MYQSRKRDSSELCMHLLLLGTSIPQLYAQVGARHRRRPLVAVIITGLVGIGTSLAQVDTAGLTIREEKNELYVLS